MRASGVTKVGLERLVVSRTKDKIACLAAPSFQDGSGSADWASAGVARQGAGRMGSVANPESSERRLMGDASIDFTFGLSREGRAATRLLQCPRACLGVQLPILEELSRRPEVAEMVDGRPRRGKRECLELLVEHLL